MDPVDRLFPRLRKLHERLQGVTIEHLDWRRCIDLYDRPTTLFYVDPPYWGFEDMYGKDVFSPEVRELYARWRVETIDTLYSAVSRRVNELLMFWPADEAAWR